MAWNHFDFVPGAILLFFYVIRLNLHSPAIEVIKKLIGVLPVAGIPYFHMFWRHLNQNFRIHMAVGIVAVLLLFRYGNRLSINQTSGYFHLPFHPHNSLFRHEGYKILIANRGLLILLAFAILLGWNALGKNYTPSAGEQYYQSMMLSLEGELTF